jgi:intergrase/recombinase
MRNLKITSCILSDHNAIKLKFNDKRNSRKYSKNWRLNSMLLHDQWVTEEIREEIKKFLNLARTKAQPTRIYGTQQRQS